MKRITILAIVIAVVVVLWSGAWIFASTLIRQNVVALASADGETTPKVTCARLDIGGYPFWFDVTCGDLAVTSGDLSANLPELKATVLAYDPFHLVAGAKGPLTIADAFTGSRQRLDWQNLEASARLTGWRVARISVVASTIALNDTVGGDVLLGKASAAEFHALDIPAQYDASRHVAGLAVYSKVDDLEAPGAQIKDGKSTFEADITGLPDDVRAYGDADLLKRWQAAGGKLKLVGFKGDDGAQNFSVAGDLALDAAARPAGQLTIGSKGLVERFGTLVPEQWRGAILGTPGADGSYGQVLNLTNGVVFSGILPIGTIPALY